jgi:hypothetical protein
MKADKLVEAIVVSNTTIAMQLQAFQKSPNDPVKVAVNLSVQLFGLPTKERSFAELEKELTILMMKKLGFVGILKSMGRGLFGKGGPLQGIQKNIIADACRKMGLTIPVKKI